MRITMTMLLLLASAQAARAQEVITTRPNASAEWNESWIDRPLVLAPRMVQANLGVDVTNVDTSNSLTGETVSAAFDVGVVPKLQVGLALSLPVNPAAFGSAIADVQFGLSQMANVRFDAGLTRASVVSSSMTDGSNGYVFGMGLPVKVKLAPQVAFISGRTSAAGFGRPMALADDTGGLAMGANPMLMGDSLFAVVVNDQGTASFVANAPVGILLAPQERVAIALHTGYRYLYIGSNGGGSGKGFNFVPFGGDVMVSLPAHVDIGVSGDVAGPVDDRSGYLDFRQFMAWAQARF